MTEELNLLREALRRVKYEAASLADAQVIALEALAQRPAAQTEREAFEAWFDDYHDKACAEFGGIDCTDPKGIAEDAWQARASLPAPQQAAPEPVGEPFEWLFQHEETGLVQVVDSQQVEWGFEINNPRWQKIRPVYTRPAPGVPDGFALVPVEPTEEMTTAVEHAMWDKPSVKGADVWSAVLAAAQVGKGDPQ